jgi:hypothetical protein
VLAPDEAHLQRKLATYYPQGVERTSTDFVHAATPEQAVSHFQELVEAGIQYVIAGLIHASDLETLRLLATDVAPHVTASVQGDASATASSP